MFLYYWRYLWFRKQTNLQVFLQILRKNVLQIFYIYAYVNLSTMNK